MPTFYRGPDVRITDAQFHVLGSDRRRHAICDLQCVWVVLPTVDRPMRIIRVCCSGSAAVAAVIFWAEAGATRPVGWVLLLLGGGIGLLELRRIRGIADRRYELWAFDRSLDELVCLYSTVSEREFGRVRRALQRALEWREFTLE
jgi:hypothetical protein